MQSLLCNLFRSILLLMCAWCLSLSAASASAITIDMVTVGNPGNPADTLVMNDTTTGYGQVNYTYNIGRYEVTNSQYTAFLNAVAATDTHSLYNTNMNSSGRGGITRSGSSGSYTYAVKTDFADKPVNYVSFWNAARFTNWLHNGQPTGAQGAGTTEDGAYVLNATNPVNTVSRDPNALFYLPSENEWYKAAYYDPTLNGGSGGYTLYATQSNSAPTIATASATGDISNPGANVANYSSGAAWNSQIGNVTTVGSAGPLSDSYYGTFDQSGNVSEWNEEIISSSFFRGLRGGSWLFNSTNLPASFRTNLTAASQNIAVGFRVASPFLESAPPSNPIVPEPASGGMLLLGLMLLRWRRLQMKKTSL